MDSFVEKRLKYTTSAEDDCVILENDCAILKNYYVGERKMTWNFNPYWCPIKREANSTQIAHHIRLDQHRQLTEPPLILLKKVSHNKLETIITWLWEGVAPQQRGGGLDLSLTVFETKTNNAQSFRRTKWTSIIIIIEAYRTWEIILIDDKLRWTLMWIIIINGKGRKKSLLLT